MLMQLTNAEVAEVQRQYAYLINYASDDPESPIGPLAYRDSNGDWLLHIAAQRGDLRTVELLVKAGVDVNQRGDMGCTALHYARQHKNSAVVEFLLSHGAATDVRDDFGKLP